MWVFTTKVLVHLFSEIGMKPLLLLPGNSNKEKKNRTGVVAPWESSFPSCTNPWLGSHRVSAKMMMFMIKLIVIIIKIN